MTVCTMRALWHAFRLLRNLTPHNQFGVEKSTRSEAGAEWNATTEPGKDPSPRYHQHGCAGKSSIPVTKGLSSAPYGGTGLADLDAKLEKLSMDSRRSPQRVGEARGSAGKFPTTPLCRPQRCRDFRRQYGRKPAWQAITPKATCLSLCSTHSTPRQATSSSGFGRSSTNTRRLFGPPIIASALDESIDTPAAPFQSSLMPLASLEWPYILAQRVPTQVAMSSEAVMSVHQIVETPDSVVLFSGHMIDDPN